LYLGGWDHGRKGRTFALRKISKIPSRKPSLSEGFSKNAKKCFFMPTPSKKANKMLN